MTPHYFNALPIASEQTNFIATPEEIKELLRLQYETKVKNTRVTLCYDILDLPQFQRIKHFILSKIWDYKENILGISDKLVLTRSWATINEKGVGHGFHNHPNALFSLVYYVDCDPKSGDFFITLPYSRLQDGYSFDYKILNNNVFNSKSLGIQTAPGSIVIFPGHLEHHASVHESDKDRLIVGANFFIDGHLGGGGYDEIDLKIIKTDPIFWGK